MKKLLYLIALCCFVHLSAAAQSQVSAPDYASIEKAISDSNSHYYYPRLFDRYVSGDTTIGLNEYKYLYYGYFFYEDDTKVS